ncbi:hypothetical protein PIROE2DRAFT_59375 [Piromyces sp. E2]|nr:hypothetical protein PIROE2DRAFT_59375 [Piromyces sp. E2]|eukprot:OUM66486.1 hypothetical protein PIROE2DRAFT_59375 [Piromyces sp. E2]
MDKDPVNFEYLINIKNNINSGHYVDIKNSVFENMATMSSHPIISNTKQTKFYISDSSFSNFSCIENIENMQFHLTSNTFNENHATNGGALYLLESENSNQNKELIMENNIFNQNTAENFGGAIYSKFSYLNINNTKNNTFISNVADINGGGIYTENFDYKEIKNKEYFKFSNNNIDYSSNPSYITINETIHDKLDYYSVNIYSGDYIPLKFTLYDKYNNKLDDIIKFYSSITLRVLLTEKTKNDDIENDDDDDINNDKTPNTISIHGNMCYFINGHCELKNLKIYAPPGEYVMSVIIENYNDDIELLLPEIIITVNNCNDDQIRMYDKDNNFYCENSKCNEKCNVGISASCIPFYKENINDKDKNTCECYSGWEVGTMFNFENQNKTGNSSNPNESVNKNENTSKTEKVINSLYRTDSTNSGIKFSKTLSVSEKKNFNTSIDAFNCSSDIYRLIPTFNELKHEEENPSLPPGKVET